MILYLLQPASNNMTRRARAVGWHTISLDRQGRKEFKERAAKLRDRGIRRIYTPDLFRASASILADILQVPVAERFELRPFNVGKFHGQPESIVAARLAEMRDQWKHNPDIPIRGGDSLTSYNRRFVREANSLLRLNEDAVLLLDARGIASLRGGVEGEYPREKIFTLSVKGASA